MRAAAAAAATAAAGVPQQRWRASWHDPDTPLPPLPCCSWSRWTNTWEQSLAPPAGAEGLYVYDFSRPTDTPGYAFLLAAYAYRNESVRGAGGYLRVPLRCTTWPCPPPSPAPWPLLLPHMWPCPGAHQPALHLRRVAGLLGVFRLQCLGVAHCARLALQRRRRRVGGGARPAGAA